MKLLKEIPNSFCVRQCYQHLRDHCWLKELISRTAYLRPAPLLALTLKDATLRSRDPYKVPGNNAPKTPISMPKGLIAYSNVIILLHDTSSNYQAT